jgi:hypothetical protein
MQQIFCGNYMIILLKIFYRKEKDEPLNDYEKMGLQRVSSKHIRTLNQRSKNLNLMTLPAGTE